MGEPFIPEVLTRGLEKGHSVATGQHPGALELAREYAGKGAHNILEGDIHSGNLPGRGRHAQDVLKRLGFSKSVLRNVIPQNLPPRGGVIRINIPDNLLSRYFGERGVMPGELRVTERVPPQYIEMLEQGYTSPAPSMFPASARKLTKKHVRLLDALVRKDKSVGATEAVEKWLAPYPGAYALTTPERLAAVRNHRKMLTRMLRALF